MAISVQLKNFVLHCKKQRAAWVQALQTGEDSPSAKISSRFCESFKLALRCFFDNLNPFKSKSNFNLTVM